MTSGCHCGRNAIVKWPCMVKVVLIEIREIYETCEIGKIDTPVAKGQQPFLAQLAQDPVHVNRT